MDKKIITVLVSIGAGVVFYELTMWLYNIFYFQPQMEILTLAGEPIYLDSLNSPMSLAIFSLIAFVMVSPLLWGRLRHSIWISISGFSVALFVAFLWDFFGSPLLDEMPISHIIGYVATIGGVPLLVSILGVAGIHFIQRALQHP